MNPEHEELLDEIKIAFIELVDPKYRKGAEEHKDNLSGLTVEQLLVEAQNEILDNFVFNYVALKKVREIKHYAGNLQVTI